MILPVDLHLTARRLLRDVRDDWFPDPLDFEDLLRHAPFLDQLHKGELPYQGEAAWQLQARRGPWNWRPWSASPLRDRLLYQAAADVLSEILDPLISPRVFSGRRAGGRDALFHRPRQNRRDFIALAREELQREQGVLLWVEPQNYWPQIPHQDLIELLWERSPVRSLAVHQTIETLQELLQTASVWPDRGLPFNRDASTFFANFHLTPIDDVLTARQANYFRWLDCILVVCENRREAERTLRELTTAFWKWGLTPDPRRTDVLACGDRWLEKLLPSADPQSEQIDQLLQADQRVLARRALPMLRRKLELALHQDDEKTLRFCLSRLGSDQADAAAGVLEANDLAPLTLKLLESRPWLADVVCRYLRRVRLSDDQQTTLYKRMETPENHGEVWRRYHLWRMLDRSAWADKARWLPLARQQRRIVDAATGPATAFLAKYGEEADRRRVALRLRTWQEPFLRRAALTGLKHWSRQELNRRVRPYLTREEGMTLRFNDGRAPH